MKLEKGSQVSKLGTTGGVGETKQKPEQNA